MLIFITLDISQWKNIHGVNPLYLFIGEADGQSEEKIGNKYLIVVSTDKIKEVLTKYAEPWDEIEYMIKTINGGEAGQFVKEHMKIKFSSHDNLPLNKVPNLHNLTIVVRSVFQENNKFYPQVFLDKCLYEL